MHASIGFAPRTNLPEVKDRELIFRTRCAAGLLNWLALAPVGAELGSKSEKQLERLLVPVVAGAFRGSSSGCLGSGQTIQARA